MEKNNTFFKFICKVPMNSFSRFYLSLKKVNKKGVCDRRGYQCCLPLFLLALNALASIFTSTVCNEPGKKRIKNPDYYCSGKIWQNLMEQAKN